jgi:hypothetical protein
MNRFFKAVLCAVVLASFIGCGGDDDNNNGNGGGNTGVGTTVTSSPIFIGLNSQIAQDNFKKVSNSTLKLSTSFLDITGLLGNDYLGLGKGLGWLNTEIPFLDWGTGSYGAKYVVTRLTNEENAYLFLSHLITDGGFNKNYLDQVFDYTILGAKLNDLLNNLGLNTEIRRYGIGYDISALTGAVSGGSTWVEAINPTSYDLYVDRASAKIKDIGNGEYLLTLTTYVTGWFSDLDEAALDTIYHTSTFTGVNAPIVSTTVEKIYSPFVISNDLSYIGHLPKYKKDLIGEKFLELGLREVVKKDNHTTYTFKYDHGGDLVTWDVEKDVNHRDLQYSNGTIVYLP